MSRRYTDADLAAILRKQGKPVDFKYRANPKPRDPNTRTESQSQQAVIKWWHHACTGLRVPEHLLMAIPLQAARTPRNGARMKAEGARKGTLDLFLAVARNGGNGLWVEMKTPTGRVSPEQVAMIADLRQQGYAVEICRSTDAAITTIMIYLGIRT